MGDATVNGYTAAQIRAAEEPLLRAGVPLMRRAAAGLADAVAEVLDATARDGQRLAALLLVGPGNNGGDALYAGARLAAGGARVLIAQVSGRIHAEGLAAALAAGAERIGPGSEAVTFAEVRPLPSEAPASASVRSMLPEPVTFAEIQPLLGEVGVIVDGILGTGTGADPRLRGGAAEVVAGLRGALDSASGSERAPAVVAVDIPSGIDPDTGAVPDGNVLRARMTVTFGGRKAGLLLAPASDYAGSVRLVEIGLEAALAELEPAVRVPVEPSD